MTKWYRSRPGWQRGQAIGLLWCLLASLLYYPLPPVLVCRMTGLPMPPVYTESPHTAARSCCSVHPSAEGYALNAPGCCDLRQSTVHKIACAAPVSPAETASYVLAAPVLRVPLPVLSPAPVCDSRLPHQGFARPPPEGNTSLRAPPLPRRLA